ncbi:MAG: hypothetical protein HY544_02680 [Candidatus Diapherotrites archaeon]|uniref:Uncharacterized protein n=1 Tax=Candidatus Iainarchaeum sp. TaxID=3101447 RepID=A0A8T3YL74_9ARCH|nr:hypothetical protein [Candidatus Diapherotrites archaeon]
MAGGKIHFSRPPRAAELERLVAGGSATFFMPRSCFSRLSSKARLILDKADAEVVIESVRGRAIELDMEKLMEVAELHRDHRTFRQIEEITGIPKSTAHYLVKYAQRQKLKGAGKVVYL